MDRPDPTAEPSGDDRCPQCGHEVGDAWLVCAWCGQQLAAPAELAAGERLADGRYQVLRVIGRGGFGITYDVGDRRLERRVAMKELFPESAVRHGSLVLTPPQGRAGFRAARERFLREARVLARFTHPGIVRVYEVFEEHGTAYLVMELLQGRTLVQLLQERNRPFPEAEVLDVAGRVAAALRPVHAAGVLHRDVNPSNVMMTHHGRIVVIDFGLARDYDEAQTVGMTRMVTPGYAPLEQYRGEGRFGPSTDVYGLAATCYRLATGKVPTSAIERDAGATLASPRALNPAISKPVSDAILDGLELEPAHRPQDLDAFLARLGLRRLPDGPRSMLLDTVPPPRPEPPLSADDVRLAPTPSGPAPVVAPVERAPVTGPTVLGEPRGGGDGHRPVPAADLTSATEVVARPARSSVSGPTVAEPGVPLDPWAPASAGPADATRPAPGGPVPAPDATATDVARRPEPRPAPAAPAGRTELARPLAPQFLAPAPERVVGGPAAPRLPGVIGPHRPGRRKLLLPLTAVALATASAAPVLVTALVVLVVLPLVATFGDSLAHRLRAEHGVVGGWAERRLAPGALAPGRFLRNVVVSTLRGAPMIGVGAVLLAGWYGLDRLTDATIVLDLALRAIGLLVVGVIVVTARDGSGRFRTALGIDALVARWVPDGRTTERIVILWIVATFVVAGALWLTPDPFPLP